MFLPVERSMRGGIIPYTIFNKRLYFLLGVDRRTHELTDFGGGIRSRETVTEGALRELHEESCYIFEHDVTTESVQNSLSVMNLHRNIVIYFLYVSPKWLFDIEQKFVDKQSKLRNKKHKELDAVRWLTQEQFRRVVFNSKNSAMWKKIQDVLRWNITWHDLKTKLSAPVA